MNQSDIDQGAELARQALIFSATKRDDSIAITFGELRRAITAIFGQQVDARLQKHLLGDDSVMPLPPNA